MMRGLQSPNMSKFARRIDFRRDTVIEVAGKLAGFAAALTMAKAGAGYWALVANTVGTPAIMVMVSYALAPYRPKFSLAEWRAFAHFLGWSSAAQVVGALSWQCDRLLLANFVPLRALGQFSLANDLSYLPEQALIKPIGRPLMAAFSLVNDQPERLARAYARAADGIFALGMAMMVGMSLLADPAVRFALGPKWIPAIPILSWLALSLIPPLAYAPVQSLAMALRRTDTFLYRSSAELALKLPLIGFGAAFFGVYGVVAGRVVIALVMAVVSMMFVKEMVGAPVVKQLTRVWRTIAAGAALALFLWFARQGLRDLAGLQLGAGLALVGAAGLIVYGAALVILWALAGKPEEGVEAVAMERAMRLLQRVRRVQRPLPR
jgi:O-antigen/teichoic acid export membrane protein